MAAPRGLWQPPADILEAVRNLPGYRGGPPGRPSVLAAFPDLGSWKAQRVVDVLKAEGWVGPHKTPPTHPGGDQRCFELEEGPASLRLLSVDSEVRTVEDAIRKGEVDLAVWEPRKTRVNSWPVAVKHVDDSVETVWLWQVSVEFRRRVSAAIADACPAIVERMKAHAPAYRKAPAVRKITDPHLLEVSLADHHFGKLAWGRETGEDWDLRIAEKVWLEAVDDLLSKVGGYPIERVLLPIGHDFFNYDTQRGETAAGTPQDNDSRPAKVFETGVSACVAAIDRCREVGPVDVVWVPGNHDPTWSFHLVHVLAAWYHLDDRVTVDVSPKPRKYVSYGVNLLGLIHGDMSQQALKQLPALMAVEAPEQWAAASYREIHIGHWHSRKILQTMPLADYSGVAVRQLPSLTGTDTWHYSKGFVGNPKAADAFLWAKNRGLSGYFTTYADLTRRGA